MELIHSAESAERMQAYFQRLHQLHEGILLDNSGVTIKWGGGFGYHIDWDRLKTPLSLLGWVQHLSGKRWVEKDGLVVFVEEVCRHKGWSLTV